MCKTSWKFTDKWKTDRVVLRKSRVLLGFAQSRRFLKSFGQQNTTKWQLSTSALSTLVVASFNTTQRSGSGVLGDERLDMFFAFFLLTTHYHFPGGVLAQAVHIACSWSLAWLAYKCLCFDGTNGVALLSFISWCRAGPDRGKSGNGNGEHSRKASCGQTLTPKQRSLFLCLGWLRAMVSGATHSEGRPNQHACSQVVWWYLSSFWTPRTIMQKRDLEK